MYKYIFLSIFLISCGKTAPQTKKSQIPQVVSLSPAITEIIYAIGAEDNLIGITNQCNWPPEVKFKQRAGDFSYPSLEKISKLNPDVILAAGPGQEKSLKKLEVLGFKVIVFHPETLEQLYENIIGIGKIFKKETRAKKLVQKMKKEIDLIPQCPARKVFIEICHKPLIGAGKNTFISSAIEKLGLKNICSTSQKYPFINAEWLISKNPDYIILTDVEKSEFLSTYPYFSKKALIELNPDTIVRPGPRIVEGLWELRGKIRILEEKNEK